MRRETGVRTQGELVIDAATGWLERARRVESPNSDERPPGATPELIVVHGISLPPGEYGGPWIDRLFTNALPAEAHPYFATICDRKVSAHVLIRRDGALTQYVPFQRRAWHAGESSYAGRSACNDFSIGIEFEGADDVDYTEAQYAAGAALVAALCKVYPTLSPLRVAGHSDIAPGRKTDPGAAFDWPRLHTLIALRMSLGQG